MKTLIVCLCFIFYSQEVSTKQNKGNCYRQLCSLGFIRLYPSWEIGHRRRQLLPLEPHRPAPLCPFRTQGRPGRLRPSSLRSPTISCYIL